MAIKQEEIFKNVTRYTTPEERAQIQSIELNEQDVDRFVEMFRQGLIEASSLADGAVQNNMKVRVQGTVRLSRPVYNRETDQVEEWVSRSDAIVGEINAQKKYKS